MYRAVKHDEQPQAENYEDYGQYIADILLWIAFDRKNDLVEWFKKNKYAKLRTEFPTAFQRKDGMWTTKYTLSAYDSKDRLEANQKYHARQAQLHRNHYFMRNIKQLKEHKANIKAWENGELCDGKVFK